MRISIAAAALLLPCAALAGGYAVPNTNVRDEGMAGSAVANQTGPEAAFANGAALAGTEGLRVSASGTLIFFRSNWSDPAHLQGDVSTNGGPATPPNLNVSYGMKSGGIPWAVGLAAAVPGGGQVQWPQTWPGRASIFLVDRRIYSVDLVGAVQPIEQLKVSLGGAYFYGTEHLKQALIFGAPATPDGFAELGTGGGKLSFTAALEVKPVKDLPLKIGFQYKHKADMVLTGQAHFDGVPDALRPQLLDQNASHALTFPNVINAGVAYDPIKDLTIQAAITFWRFIVYKADDFIGDRGVDIHIPFNYTNAMTYRLGAEYGGILPGLKVRAGILRDVTPQPVSTISPALPTSSNVSISCGATYDITPALSVSAATEYAMFDQATTTGDAFPSIYSPKANLVTIGLAYKMK